MVSEVTIQMHGDAEIPGLVVERNLTNGMDKNLGIRRFRVRDERPGAQHPADRRPRLPG